MRKAKRIKDVGAPSVPGGSAPSTPTHPSRAGRWRLLLVLGVLMALAGAIGAGITLTAPHLAQQMIPSAAPGMVQTATGNGAAEPTATLLAATRVAGVQGSGYVPVTPTLYLPNAVVESNGAKEPALWQVWWDAGAQVEAVVCLQSHLSNSDAATEVNELRSKDAAYTNLDDSTYTFTSGSQFNVPGISGATGYLWRGTEQLAGTAVPIEYRFSVFSRGSVVALVSMTAFNRRTDAASFRGLAAAEYSQMSHLDLGPALAFVFLFLAGIGLAVLAGIKRHRWNKRLAAMYPRPFPPAGAPGYWPAPYAGYAAYPPYAPYAGSYAPPPYAPAPYWPGSYWPPPPPQGAAPAAVQRAAGWYEDPEHPAGEVRLRYFDGRSWTPSTAPAPAATPEAMPEPED